MIRRKGITVFESGDWNNLRYTKHVVNSCVCPKEVPITVQFDSKRVIGTAKNFKVKDGKITADIGIEPEYKGFYIAPTVKCEVTIKKKVRYIDNFEVIECSIVSFPLSRGTKRKQAMFGKV